MQTRFAFPVLAVSGLLTLVVGARAGEENIPLEKIPAAVTKAVKTKFPKAKIEKASKEVEDGQTTYEIEIEDNESDISVSLKEDGTILEIEKEIAVKDLPAAVTAAVKTKYPTGVLKKAEEVSEGGKMSFEVVVSLEGKKPRELELDRAGKILDDEEAEEDDD